MDFLGLSGTFWDFPGLFATDHGDCRCHFPIAFVKGKWYIWYGHGDFCAVLVRSPICAVLARSMTAPKVDHDVPYPNTAHKFTFGTVLGGMISHLVRSTQPVCTFGMVIQCKEFAVAELL